MILFEKIVKYAHVGWNYDLKPLKKG